MSKLMKRPKLKYLGAALVGSFVAAAAALLLAPASGRETRRKLARRLADEREALALRGNRALGGVSEYLYDQFEESKRKLAAVANG